MKRVIAFILLISIATLGISQSTSIPAAKRSPFRLKIRSADPWFVKAMLEGIAVNQPELSTIPGFAGIGSAVTNGLSKLFEGGHFIVNPTDNSLWFIPD